MDKTKKLITIGPTVPPILLLIRYRHHISRMILLLRTIGVRSTTDAMRNIFRTLGNV